MNGGTTVNPSIGPSSETGADVVSGNTIKGTGIGTNNTNTINFASPVTQISIQYCAGPDIAGDPAEQFVFISNFNWADEVLPVRLASFKGQQVKEYVGLGWETASEANSDRFEIERSSDTRSFERIGSVTAHGFSNDRLLYSFTDNAPLAGFNYYRLRQVDRDGSFEYSKVIVVRYEQNGFYYVVNAVDRGQLLVQTNALAPQFGVYSMQGFPQLTRIEPKGDNQYVLHLNQSANTGVQIVKLQSGAAVYTKKVLVAR